VHVLSSVGREQQQLGQRGWRSVPLEEPSDGQA
jgi:hypothetical protein